VKGTSRPPTPQLNRDVCGVAWMFMARIGVIQVLHRHESRQFNRDAKEHHWEAEAEAGPVKKKRPQRLGAVEATLRPFHAAGAAGKLLIVGL
jgi:hypothetical protein